MPDVAVIAGCRLPFQRAHTAYADCTAYDLGRLVLQALLERTGLSPEHVDRVILGNVIAQLQTSNVARESALAAGIPMTTPAHTVTQACISANQAIATGADLIRTGQAQVVVAGGTESMSDTPIQYKKSMRRRFVAAQRYKKASDYLKFIKGLRPKDWLPEVPAIAEFSTRRTMGQDCERMAGRFGVTRTAQDAFALRSHQQAAAATEAGLLQEEIAPVALPQTFTPITTDNGIRGDSSAEKLATLRPAFARYGTLTAGNASFLTDGAAVVLLMDMDAAHRLGFSPQARIRAYTFTAQNPEDELLLGPAYATPKVLDMAGVTLADIEVFEFHEAFAAQVLANLYCLDSDAFAQEKLGRASKVGEVPMDRLNVQGGSLSIGHPFGATGARLVTTATNRLHREEGTLALIASCAAGALGHAMLLERVA